MSDSSDITASSTVQVQPERLTPAAQRNSEELGLAGGLPAGWAEANLFDLCRPKQWPTILTKDLSKSGYPVYGANGKIGFHSDYSHEEPTILVTCRGSTCGTLNVCEPKSWVNGSAMCLEDLATDAVEFAYALYALKNRGFDDVKSGSAQPQITKAKLKAVTVPLAPRAEQVRIVSAIESLQMRSACAKQAIAEARQLLCQLRQSVLRDAFRGRLNERWRIENPDVKPASELLAGIRIERRERWEANQLAKYNANDKDPPTNWRDKYKEPDRVDEFELPELPESWCWTSVEEIASLEPNSLSCGPFGARLGKRDYAQQGVPVIRAQNISGGTVSGPFVYVSAEKASDLERSTARPDDVVMVAVGSSSGHSAIVPKWLKHAVLSQNCMKVTCDTNLISAEFVTQYLQSDFAQELISFGASGTIRKFFSLKSFKKIAVPLPPIAEQRGILDLLGNAVASLASLSEVLSSSEAELTQLDQSILAKAFRGELVPQDPADEPAARLLHRIRATVSEEQTTNKKAKTRK